MQTNNLMKLNKLMAAAFALGTMLPVVNFSQVAMAGPPEYGVITYFTIDRSVDGPLDNTIEVYGEVRINGVLSSQIPPSSPQSRSAGGVPVGRGLRTVTGNSMMVFAVLMDRNTGRADDPVFRMPAIQVNLAAMPNGGERTYSFTSPDGSKGSTLHVLVNRR
jgi:hypothetical protein